MIVSVDVQSTLARRAGVGRYTAMLVRHLPPVATGDTLRLFYFDFNRRGCDVLAGIGEHRAIRWIPGRVVQQAWKRLNFPPYDWFAGRADVYHFTNFVRPPLGRGRSVVTVYDVSFLRHPETTEPKNLAYLSAKIRPSVERADIVLTISEFSRREIVELLGVPPDRVVSIPLAASPALKRPPEADIADARRRHKLDRPYLFWVGTVEPRKNLPFLFEVFERLDDFDGDLVLAGSLGWTYEPILRRLAASPRADRIRRLDYVPDSDLPALYAGAEALVFPSLYEGFGFPPLEAMACGTPVVAARRASLPEVVGAAGEMPESFDAGEWADAIRRVLPGGDRRETCIRLGYEQAGRFSWDETARRTWALYRTLGGRAS